MTLGLGKTETFSRLEAVALGEAQLRQPRVPGDLRFQFEKLDCLLVGISSVLYFTDIYASRGTYPYSFGIPERGGLFECLDSSYLRRATDGTGLSGGIYENNKHFIYFDRHFHWHIIAEGVEID